MFQEHFNLFWSYMAQLLYPESSILGRFFSYILKTNACTLKPYFLHWWGLRSNPHGAAWVDYGVIPALTDTMCFNSTGGMHFFDTHLFKSNSLIPNHKPSSWKGYRGLTYHVTIGLRGRVADLQRRALTRHNYIYFILVFIYKIKTHSNTCESYGFCYLSTYDRNFKYFSSDVWS